MQQPVRGIEQQQEIAPRLLLRDTRTLGQRIADFFKNPVYVSIVIFSLGIAAIVMPAISDAVLAIGICCFAWTFTRKLYLPFRMPRQARTIDYNDLTPGTNKPNKARGITFFGNDKRTNEELWFHNEDMRTHVLIFGSTGSGKTEFLISLAYNAIIQGSGFIYVDGKGDNALYTKIFSMVRSLGREDDLLLINFMTGARDIVGPQEKRLSNTFNPFAMGSSSMLSQLVISLMDSAAQTPDGDMWKGRAISFVEALMKILVYMRDEGHILLDANTVRQYFLLPKLEAIVIDKQFPRDKQEAVSLEGIPEVIMEPIEHYLFNLPGYNREKKGKQVSQVLEQHGFITMQLTRVFTSLADTYGHIIRVNLAEVDFRDVVLNRRILVVLLPALEKSPDELANLGKVIVSSLKAMMAAGLGEEVEGTYEDLIKRKVTNAPTPFLCILDEYGYYAVQGFSVVPAQARSLGFSAVFAGQDLPAFQKASKEEAASIGANTNIKICMKLEDPTETWDFFMKTAGEAYVTKVDSFQTKETSITNAYLDTRSASYEKRARIDLLDLKDQVQGDGHIFFQSKIIRFRTFYADPPAVKETRLNQFLRVDTPPLRQLVEMERKLDQFRDIVDKGDYQFEQPPLSEEIAFLVDSLQTKQALEPIERGVNTLLEYHNRHVAVVPKETEEAAEEEISEDELNIFTKLRIDDSLREYLLIDDYDTFGAALLARAATRTQVNIVERLSGKTERHAANIANEIVKDMQIATYYPPHTKDACTTEQLAAAARELSQHLRTAREQANNKNDDDKK